MSTAMDAAAAALRQLGEAFRVLAEAIVPLEAALPRVLTRAAPAGCGGRWASRQGRMAGRWMPPPAPAYARTRWVRGRLVTGL